MKKVPSRARAMPTEPMIRYFQAASRECRLWLKYTSGAVVRVVVSMATQTRPGWRAWASREAMLRKHRKQTTKSRWFRSGRRAR